MNNLSLLGFCFNLQNYYFALPIKNCIKIIPKQSVNILYKDEISQSLDDLDDIKNFIVIENELYPVIDICKKLDLAHEGQESHYLLLITKNKKMAIEIQTNFLEICELKDIDKLDENCIFQTNEFIEGGIFNHGLNKSTIYSINENLLG